MPEDLNAFYERTLFHLCWLDPSTAVSNERLVYRILIFIAFSGRPVTIAEAAEFAIIEDPATEIDIEDRFEDPMSILPLVGTLVTLQDSILTLAHKSVKDFLESPRARWGSLQMGEFLGMSGGPDDIGTVADTFIAQRCLGYLTQSHLSARQMMATGIVKDPNTMYLGRLQRANPLLDYAARMWPYHLRDSIVQQSTRDDMRKALQLNLKKGQPNLWQGWLFLQRVDIWERQVWLAGFLCECYIRASLVVGWTNNFWHCRQNYRVTSNATSESSPGESDKLESTHDMSSKTVLGPRSRQFFDLALLFLEIGFQKTLYSQRWKAMEEIRTSGDIQLYIENFQKTCKEVIPRMGEGYHQAVAECLQLVMHKDIEGPYARPIFQTQSHMIESILQPLRSSASSGFRRSRGIWTYKSTDIKKLHAKVEEHQNSHRFSAPTAGISNPMSSFSPFSRTHRPDGSVKSFVGGIGGGQGAVSCPRCKTVFPSQEALTSHGTKNNGYCQTCRVCLPNESLTEHHKRHNYGDSRWSCM